MVAMSLKLRGDGAWPDLADASNVIHLGDESVIDVAVLKGGMASGRPSVALRIDLPDGRVVVAETSARLFVTTARAIEAAYPGLLE